MEKYRSIPQGYMTVGEAAKKMGVTVRTLQHYDKQGLLSPSAVSEGGRRLYTDKDIVKLPKPFVMAGKLFPAAWGFAFMTESAFTWRNLWPLLVIFIAAALVCAVLLKKIETR